MTRIKGFCAILLGAAMMMPVCAGAAEPQALVATTQYGDVRGAAEDGVISWKGIPFAAPPIDALRWQPPRPPQRWSGVRETTAYRNDCMQEPFPSDAAPLGTKPAEDCLYLNIWKPAGATGKLPVMLWIYGGGFVNGGSSPPTYSGAPIARQGVMVVSFNYRLGRFGTFRHPALGEDQAVNYGLLDQIAALQWMQRNIANFGGDPQAVTIVGESAGGRSVHALMTTPLARDLFDRAVIMSGGDGKPGALSTPADAERLAVLFGQSQGIAADAPDAAARLRALPARTVVGDLNLAKMDDFFSPVTDGRSGVDVIAAHESGRAPAMPVMIGATSADIGGPDGRMVAGARDLARLFAGRGMPTYAYRFSYVAESVGGKDAYHATDIPFFFDTQAIKYGAATTPRDNRMGETMSAYLVNFVKRGDPNGEGLPQWPRYRADAGKQMDFATSGDAVAD